jgi:hypothetical protein
LRNPHTLRNVTLGTGLTALFLLVRCSVPERDYTPLGIRENGSGGDSGSGGDGSGGTAAGQAGTGGMPDVGGQGGQAGAMPVAPVPCDPVSEDAGTRDAGADDAGSSDAGSDDAVVEDAGTDDTAADPCECVDGFVRAIDADGDGDGTRACSVAPGLDCDDGDDTVTHNTCGGCSALPSTIGEDCLDCGTYTCEGPDSVVCASKPNPTVVDPDCSCVDAVIVARDTDADGQGSRLCEQNPGSDCNDGDETFVTNACGGCESLPGAVGATCNVCGVYTCSNGTMVCLPPPGAASHRCLTSTTSQACVGNGFWDDAVACGNVCYQGNCEVCAPGTFQCLDLGGGSTQVLTCGADSSSVINWVSYDSCVPGETCNADKGTCTGQLMWPQDRTFDVVPRIERGGLRWHDVLNTASDADYG